MDSVLVNFRVPMNLLERFDGICSLAGFTRTQVLRKLIDAYVREASADLPQKIAEDRRISVTIKKALRNREKRLAVSRTAKSPNDVQRRLKSFSDVV